MKVCQYPYLLSTHENLDAVRGLQDLKGDCARRARTLHSELLLAASSTRLSVEA